MPVITVQMTEGRSVTQKRDLAKRFTEEFCRICGAAPEAVTVVLQEIPNEHWAMAGKTKGQVLEEQAKKSSST